MSKNFRNLRSHSVNGSMIFKVVVIVLLVASLGMNGYLFYKVSNISSAASADDTTTTVVNKVDYDVTTTTTEVVKQVSPATVGVVCYQNNEAAASGSGVIYKKSGTTYYIITNNHVVSGYSSIQVLLNSGDYVDAKVLGEDQYSDIAVLTITSSDTLTVAEIGDSSSLDQGETVLAIGSPMGVEYYGSVTQGIVSGTNRTISMDINDDGTDDWDMNVIQTDAAINPGNSGGGLFNLKGELVGITSSKLADTSVEGMGFAIPIDDAMSYVKQIETNGKVSRPVLGISGASIDGLSRYELYYYGIDTDLDTGVYVSSVESGSAASKAGMQKGDIIVKFDGKDVTTYKSFLTNLYSHKAGDTVTVVVNRSGKEVSLKVTLGD